MAFPGVSKVCFHRPRDVPLEIPPDDDDTGADFELAWNYEPALLHVFISPDVDFRKPRTVSTADDDFDAQPTYFDEESMRPCHNISDVSFCKLHDLSIADNFEDAEPTHPDETAEGPSPNISDVSFRRLNDAPISDNYPDAEPAWPGESVLRDSATSAPELGQEGEFGPQSMSHAPHVGQLEDEAPGPVSDAGDSSREDTHVHPERLIVSIDDDMSGDQLHTSPRSSGNIPEGREQQHATQIVSDGAPANLDQDATQRSSPAQIVATGQTNDVAGVPVEEPVAVPRRPTGAQQNSSPRVRGRPVGVDVDLERGALPRSWYPEACSSFCTFLYFFNRIEPPPPLVLAGATFTVCMVVWYQAWQTEHAVPSG